MTAFNRKPDFHRPSAGKNLLPIMSTALNADPIANPSLRFCQEGARESTHRRLGSSGSSSRSKLKGMNARSHFQLAQPEHAVNAVVR